MSGVILFEIHVFKEIRISWRFRCFICNSNCEYSNFSNVITEMEKGLSFIAKTGNCYVIKFCNDILPYLIMKLPHVMVNISVANWKQYQLYSFAYTSSHSIQ